MRSVRRSAGDARGAATLITAAAAGLLSFAAPLPAVSQPAEKVAVLVMPRPAAAEHGWIAERTRQLIIARLAAHGFSVRDLPDERALQLASTTAGSGVLLAVDTGLQLIDGTYSRQAALTIGATLMDRGTRRVLAEEQTGEAAPWRVPAGCTTACLDRLAYRRAEPLAVDLAARLARRLSRLARDGALPEGDSRTIAFRGLDPALMPEIRRYLGVFPGVTDLKRVRGDGREAVFRYRLAGKADATEDSLRRMMRQMQLDGRVRRAGKALIVEATAKTDW